MLYINITIHFIRLFQEKGRMTLTGNKKGAGNQ